MRPDYEVVWNGVNDGRDGDLLGVPRFDGARYTPELVAPVPTKAPKPKPVAPSIPKALTAREEARRAFAALFPDRPPVVLPSAPAAVKVLGVMARRTADWLSAGAVARHAAISRPTAYVLLLELTHQRCVAVRRVPGRRRPTHVYQLRPSRPHA